MEVVEIKVHLHCKACENSIRRTLIKLKGVTCVETDVISSKITVLGYIDQSTIVKAVRRTGRCASDWSSHRHSSSRVNSISAFRYTGYESRKRLVRVTEFPAVEKKFPTRRFQLSQKILRAMCLKGK